MNFRINAAGEILGSLRVRSVLDVGCRKREAKGIVPAGAEYFGNDLFQDDDGGVAFVGNVLELEFGRTFDCVMALDIVEHVDDPHRLMDKLIALSNRYLLVSLPNTYDLLHKYNFVVRSTLGRKYQFGVENSLDRHRWVMNYDEIYRFFAFYGQKYGMKLATRNLLIGERSDKVMFKVASRIASAGLGNRTMTRTVLAFFSKDRTDD